MPRKAAFKIRAIDELFKQLRYVPPVTRQRQMDAAEQLIHEIDPARNYPESFIVYRITGYRPESAAEEATLVGEALVPDLTNFVLRLSERLSLPAQGKKRTALTLEEVAAKLDVAHRSIQRYRRRGLVVHSIVYPDGSRKLGCFEDALERFVGDHHETVSRAAAFSRVDDSIEQRIIDDARRLRSERHTSLNAVARQIAEQHGRAHETVRRILQRHERESDQPIFAEHGLLTDRDAQLIYRAWRRSVPVQTLAEHFSRAAVTIHRIVNRQRAAQLASLDLSHVNLPTFALDDAESVLLSVGVANEGFDRLLPMHDALELLEQAANAETLNEHDEGSLVACYNFLKKRAANALADLPEWPGARTLDEIETSLRWATLIKRRLVSAALPAALGMIEQHVGRRLAHQPSEEIRSHIALAVRTVSSVIETIDPGKSQRLDRVSRYSIAREMARLPVRETEHRATARHASGTVVLQPLFAELTEWNRLLALPERFAARVNCLPIPGRTIITRHYGLDGSAPQTCAAIARSMNITDAAVRRQLTNQLAELRRLARDDSRE